MWDTNIRAEQQYLAGEREAEIEALRNDPAYYADEPDQAKGASA